ncbi:MAG: polyprenyl synthetase family protein [Tepidisphaerales bacterium]
MPLEVINDIVRDEMAAVEERFNIELFSDLACVNTLVRHVARFRGKMLRPMLLLLCGKAAGTIGDAHTTLATVVEMVHMSTLVHDDVLDEAELRRKGATINHLRGNEAAVMLGDYLISHSYHLCSSLDSQHASRLIARTTNQLCEGELLQINHRHNYHLDEKTYLDIITRKTAVLIAASCALGTRYAGGSAAMVSAVENYGLCLGIAFQIQDDILDIVGEPSQVGKTLGIDIEKGKMTLPLIHFMRSAPRQHRDLLLSLLKSESHDKTEKIRNLILPSESIPFARHRAQEYVDEARQSLEALPDSEPRRVLDMLADFVVNRPM